MLFTGTYEHSIDAKNRLAVPSEVRALLARDAAGQGAPGLSALYVTMGEGQSLALYTERDFERRAEELNHSDMDPDELLAYERVFYSLANRVEIDSQGRVRLPDHLLRRADLGSDVVLIGVKDHLEIRNRQVWQQSLNDELTARPGLMMNPRRAMKRRSNGTNQEQQPGNG
ncbi:MAG: hypothetical protein WD042_04845 [Phycisphaeraceae bacterium]